MLEPFATVPGGQADFGLTKSAHDPRDKIVRICKRVVEGINHFIATSSV